MSTKFMKSAAVLGTATLASLLLVACGSKTADKPADSGSSEAKEITFYVEDQYKAFAESAALSAVLLPQATKSKLARVAVPSTAALFMNLVDIVYSS